MKYLFDMYKKWEREIRSSINHSILKKKKKKEKEVLITSLSSLTPCGFKMHLRLECLFLRSCANSSYFVSDRVAFCPIVFPMHDHVVRIQKHSILFAF